MDGHTVTAPSDISAAAIRIQQHERGIHAVSVGRHGTGITAGRGRRGGELACRRINVSGRLYLGSVTSPGVTTRVPSGGEGASPAQGARPWLNGHAMNGAGPSGPRLAGTGGLGTVARPEAGGAGTADGTGGLGEAELGGAWVGGGLVGGALVGGVAEVDLGLLEFAVVDLETTGWSPEQAAITE